jgi:hypothetical protein
MRSAMRTARSTPPSTTGSSRDVSAPSPNATSTVSSAICASSEDVIGGSSSAGDRLVPDGRAHSPQIRMATALPCSAQVMMLPAALWARSASACSRAMVALLREPGGRPAGLPLCPGWNFMVGLSSLVLVF